MPSLRYCATALPSATVGSAGVGMSVAALRVRGLTRRFGARVAVQDLDLHVEEGDVYGFLGPNGSGKTTAMRCILGLIAKDAGEVEIFGATDRRQALRSTGAIIEVPAFHGWLSGWDNLLLSAGALGLSPTDARAEVARVLDRVGLSERSKDRAAGYSLGMKQRLGIARALLGRPRLLLLDEPTNGLDPRGMREMRDLIRSLALHDRITVFISSHLLAEVQAVCNRVGILQDGRLRAEGAVSELLGGVKVGVVVDIGAEDPAALSAVLSSLPGLEILGPGERGRLRVRLEAGGPADLLPVLVARGVRVDALVPSDRSLEDVFLEVTR